PLRRRSHAAISDADVLYRAVLVQREPEGAQRGGDILVAPLGDFVDGEFLALGRQRHLNLLHEFTCAPVLLAIGDEEILQRNGAALHALAQRQPRTQRDQRRRSVANGRTVGDVSADRAHIAHLFATYAGYQLPKRRDAPGQGGESLAVGNAGSDGNDAVALRDRLEPVQPADEDDGRDLAH